MRQCLKKKNNKNTVRSGDMSRTGQSWCSIEINRQIIETENRTCFGSSGAASFGSRLLRVSWQLDVLRLTSNCVFRGKDKNSRPVSGLLCQHHKR
jgi:hypothetical protein